MRVLIHGVWTGVWTGVWIGGLSGLFAMLPHNAEACSPWTPHVEQTMPLEGDVHPANASVLIWGQVLDPEGLQATVDDEPATFVVGPRSRGVDYFVWGPALRTLDLRIEPPPQLGQRVDLFGELCTPDAELSMEPGCADFELHFEVGPPQLDPPLLDLDLWYDVYDHGSKVNGTSSCWTPPGRFSIDIRIDVDEQAPAPTYFEVYRRPRDEPGAWTNVARRWRLDTGHDPSGVHLVYLLEEVAGWLPLADAFCFELRTEDLAGNAGTTIERCPPCHDQFGQEESSFISSFPDAAPYYTDESIHPEGYCPQSVLDGATTGGTGSASGEDETGAGSTGGSTSGEGSTGGGELPADPLPDRGCSCMTAPASGGPWGLGLGLLVLGALRRRVGCA